MGTFTTLWNECLQESYNIQDLCVPAYKNEGLADINYCQRRQFNETLHLPLCSAWTDTEHIYDVSIRVSKITKSKVRLEGPWMISLQTSFMCKGPQGL